MKTKKSNPFVLFALILITLGTEAQELTQTLRGTVVDKVTQMPIPGAVVHIENTNPAVAVMCDGDGHFNFGKVSVGKQSLRVSMLGYHEVSLQNLSLNSGKELVLTVQMEEDVTEMEAVDVVAQVDKSKPLNDMSTVSTRAFSVEETQKFAAAANDPARMALAFAGVVSGPDGNNIISIRGNSPNGLLWRMEGVEIPNPNHFSNVGTSGGGISILSSQLLNNSDFSTGAFAAEYGNALSGVFDLRLRRGNNEKREYTIQAGVLGLDLSAEGPFKKGYEGSFLINYRYSTLSVMSMMGVPLGDAITNFQDLSFNVYLPTRKLGNFTLFGFGGLSDQTTSAKKDSVLWKEDVFSQYDSKFHSNTGAVGLTHTKPIGTKSYLRTVLLFSANDHGYYEDKLSADYKNFVREYDESYVQAKNTLSSVYTTKINAKNNVRTGLIFTTPAYSLRKSSLDDQGIFAERLNVKGTTTTAQTFAQWNHKLSSRFSTNLGLHYFQLFLNNSNSIEPRAALKFEATPKNIFTFGYGLHSQLQPTGLYFAEQHLADNTSTQSNKNLGLSKAHHMVGGYDRLLNSFTHAKVEVYYQYLFNIPISTDPTSTYSQLNAIDGYYDKPLVNNGLGRNTGLELTLERFLHKNIYYLVSASLYDSKYKAPNGSWYNTRFNTNFALSITAGKEWSWNKKDKNRVIGLNVKSLFVGGFRYTPIDLPASIAAGETRFDDSQTFEEQNPYYYRLDVRASIKRNYKNLTSTFAIDIQNTTNRKNVGGQYFDSATGEVKYWYQAPLLPLLSYRIEF